MAATLSGTLLGLYVLLWASLASQAYVLSSNHRHIVHDEHMLLRQKNHGKRFLVGGSSHSSLGGSNSYYHVSSSEFDPCRSVYCGTGTCMMTSAYGGMFQTSLPHCSCPYGYYGSQCEIYDPCYNYGCVTGTCQLQANNVDAYCTCPAGYSGDYCEHFDPCHNYTCGTGQCQGYGFVANCICPTGYFGDHCEIVPTTTTPTTTTTTTALPTTALTRYTCKTAQSMADLASNVQSNNVNASNCTTGDNAGSDAFVLNYCDVEQPAAWKRGQNVMLICNSVPIYTPIATFAYTRYNPGTDTAAIFLGCLGDEIRIGLQTCDAGTRIEHFKMGGQGYRDATQYYVIQ